MSKPDRRRVWPAPNRTVRDPLTRRVIPAGGVEVEWSTYWERKRLDGDVTLAAPAAAPAPADMAGKQSSKGA